MNYGYGSKSMKKSTNKGKKMSYGNIKKSTVMTSKVGNRTTGFVENRTDHDQKAL